MGQRSFSDGPALTPSSFASMPPHMQTEACLLAREAGFKLGSIAASVDEPELRIKTIMETRHRHNPFGIERAATVADVREAAPKDSVRSAVLHHLAAMGTGVIEVTQETIAFDLDIGLSSVSRAIRHLTGSDMIRCVRAGKPGQVARFQVTRLGRETADEAAP